MSPRRGRNDPARDVAELATLPTVGQSFDVQLGAHLASVREGAGISQDALALQMRRDQSLVSRVETGQRRVAVSELLEWAAALGVAPERLFASVVAIWLEMKGTDGSLWHGQQEDSGG